MIKLDVKDQLKKQLLKDKNINIYNIHVLLNNMDAKKIIILLRVNNAA